jgi:hypothetical protein
MLTISKDKCTLALDRQGLLCEASDIGLAPGEWPDFIAVVDDSDVGYLFGFPQFTRTHDDDVMLATYKTADLKFDLVVLND